MDTAVRELGLAPISLLSAIAGSATGGDPATPQTRARVLEEVKQALADGRRRIRAAFEAGAPVHDTMAANADLIDQLLRDLLDFATTYVFPAPNRRRETASASPPSAAMAVASSRRGRTSICCSCCPTRRRRAASRSSSTSSTCSGTPG